MGSLKNKTVSGVLWAALQKIGSRGIGLVTTILLARILTPKDFGLIGMLSVVIAVSQTLVQAGFKQALIQKKEADEEDYSSVFYINLVVSIFIYGVLYFTAPLIADFYDQPLLIDLTRVLALIFVINAFSYVQEARLAKEMHFKTLMFVHLPSTVISGVVAIAMALLDFGVWSIVGQQITMRLAFAIQIWIHSKWKPLRTFNKKKAKGLFSFGSNLMISGVIHSLFDNVYLIIIGRFFPAATLGYYQNGKKLVDMPTRTLSSVLTSVTFPAFSAVQDDNKRLKKGYRQVIQQILFWLCPLLVFAAVLAEPLFSFVLTDKWLPAVPFFRLLCIYGIFYPLNSYNLNILNVKGRSDLFLKLSIFKRSLTIAGIFLIIPYGVWALVLFQAAFSVAVFFVNSFYSGRFIDYPVFEQLKDISSIFILTVIVGGIVLIVNNVSAGLSDIVRILIGSIIGVGLYWGGACLWKFKPYEEFKNIFTQKINYKSLRTGK